MNTLMTIRAGLDRVLEIIVAVLILAITVVIVIGFTWRLLGSSLSWTGEISGIGLAWLTYYGSALAASRGAHIASPSLVEALPPALRVPLVVLAEGCTIGFFALLAWTGFRVVMILKGSSLVSLPFISQQITQSVIPIASGLFIIAELLRLPEVIAHARGKDSPADYELKKERLQAALVDENQNRNHSGQSAKEQC